MVNIPSHIQYSISFDNLQIFKRNLSEQNENVISRCFEPKATSVLSAARNMGVIDSVFYVNIIRKQVLTLV